MTVFQPAAAAYIQQRIAAACEDGSRTLTLTGNYEIEAPIRLPSDFTLTLDNCHLRMADGTFCNMLVNEHCRTEEGRTLAGTDRNIRILGVGKAILDGGEYNGLSERNSCKDGMPHISHNNLLLFTNVDGFEIRNLHLRDQRWWAMNFIYSRNGHIADIDFRSNPTWVAQDGIRYDHLSSRGYGPQESADHSYNGVLVKNSDGIDLRSGCHNILIENITGFTEDDTIALTGLRGRLETMFEVEGLNPDIRNVTIRNVMSSAFCANIRLLNQSGIRLYNILIDGVTDTSADSPYMDRGGSGIRIGDTHLYGTRHATADETFNITVRNVYSRAATVMRIAGAMKDCLFENIRAFDAVDGAGVLLENNATVDITPFLKN